MASRSSGSSRRMTSCGMERGRVVVAQQEHVQQVVVGHVLAAVQHELVRVDDAALAHHEHVHARHRLLAEQAHHVGVQVARGHGVLLVGQAVDGVDARLDACRALEVELGGRLLHLAGQLVHELAVLAGQEPLDAPHVLGVLLRRDAAAARAGAQAHVRVEARALHLAVQERVFVAAFQLARHARAIRRTTWRTKGPRGARCPPCRGRRGCRCRVRSSLRVGSVPLARVLDGRDTRRPW